VDPGKARPAEDTAVRQMGPARSACRRSGMDGAIRPSANQRVADAIFGSRSWRENVGADGIATSGRKKWHDLGIPLTVRSPL